MKSSSSALRGLLSLALLLPLSLLFAQKTGDESRDKTAPPVTERQIFIPFEELSKTLNDDGRGVFLPYREFLEMWEKLEAASAEEKLEEPPQGAAVSSAVFTAKPEGENAIRIEADLTVVALREGWSSIDLGDGGAAISAVESGKATLSLKEGRHHLLLPEKGTYEVKLQMLAAITREGGRQKVTLKLPKAAVSRFALTLPEEKVDFQIEPAAPHTVQDVEGKTELQFFSGAGSDFTLAWEKEGESVVLEPLVFADVDLAVHVGTGAVTTSATVAYQIYRTGLDHLELTVPAPHEVIKVEGQGIRQWDLKPAGENQNLVIDLHDPAEGTYQLLVQLEAPVEALPANSSLPALAAEEVQRQRGRITLTSDRSLNAQLAGSQGLTQESGAGAAGKEGAITSLGTFRYLRAPFSGELDIRKATPVVEVESFTRATVEPDLILLHSRLVYTVKRVGIFGTRIALPDGYTAIECTGDNVEDFHVEDGEGDEAGKILVVSFKAQALGSSTLNVTGRRLRDTEDEPLTVPALRPTDSTRHEAKIGLEIHTSLDPNTTDIGGFRQQDIGSLSGQLAASGRPNAPLTLGFRYRDDGAPAELAFTLKKPQVTGDLLLLTEIQEQLVKHHWRIDLAIRYAGIDAFIVQVPDAIADDLRHDERQVKEVIKDWEPEAAEAAPAADPDPAPDAADPPEDKPEPALGPAPEGFQYWRIALRDRKLGTTSIDLTYEMPFPNVQAGEATPITLPELSLVEVFRETGQVAVLKDGNLEVLDAKPEGLEEIDPKELRGELAKPGVFLAYKYKQHPISLGMSVSKNVFLPVPQAVVTYADITAAVSSDRGIIAESVYWVRNNSKQFLGVKLPPGGEMLSDVFVRGKPQQPMRRANSDEMLVRLPGGAETGEASFPVRFVYSIPSPDAGKTMGAIGSLEFLPATVVDASVLESQLEIHLPADYLYPRFKSAMRRSLGERGWASFRRMTDWLVPALGPDEERGHGRSHVSWNAPPELPSDQAAGFDFEIPADGQRFLFHRLGAADSVKASFRSRGWAFTWEALACLVALVIGLVLLRKRYFSKTLYFCVVGLGSLVVAGAVQPGAAGMWRAIFLGVLAAAIIWLVATYWKAMDRLLGALRERRARKRAEKAAKGLAAKKQADKPKEPSDS